MAATWSPDSWRSKPIVQVPTYPDMEVLKDVEAKLESFPPLVFAGESRALKEKLAEVAAGRWLPAPGRRLRRELQGASRRQYPRLLPRFPADGPGHDVRRRPSRSSRSAASPASSPNPAPPTSRSRAASTLPSYRGDIINGAEFTSEARIPDPQRQLQAYRQSAATLNFLRAFVQGGYADLCATYIAGRSTS